MTADRQSLQDRIRNRQQSGFIGRQGQMSLYQENLALPVEDQQRRFLFNLHGDAGVGKTYLTKQLKQLATDAGALTAYSDETVDDVTAAMSTIAEQFSRFGVRLGDFEKRAAAYRKRRHEMQSDPNAPAGVAAFLTATAVRVGLHAASGVPIAGSVLAPVDPAAAAEQANRARAYLASKIRDRADVRLLLSPADELTPVFVSGLNRAAAHRPIALFFDTYERTAPLLERWLLDLYGGRYGDLPETLVTTISGQLPLNPNLWSDYLPVLADVALEPFSDAEARQFLASKNITDEPTIEVILTLSGRLPLWLVTLADGRPDDVADIGDPAGDAVQRFLKWEDDPARRDIAVTAALPRSLNQDVLAVVTPADQVRQIFAWVCALPFVSQQAESWKYHEVVRSAMLRLQRAQSPAGWRASHLALAQAHAAQAAEAAGGTDQTWANQDWVDHAREETYHLLCADPAGNLPRALASAVKAAERSIIGARQWAGLLADAGRDADHPALREWGQRLRDGIHDNSDLTEYLTHLINHADLDKAILTAALKERGESYRLTDRNDEALADFSRAIELDPSLAWAIGSRGQAYRDLERYDDAVADFSRAIELDPSLAWAITGRGLTYQAMQRNDDALSDYSRAIELDPGNIFAITCRGRAYQAMERYDDAVADFSRAIELDPGNTWAITCRGRAYQDLERYDEALADYNRAIELDPGYIWAISSRGQTCRLMGHYDDAVADFTRAIELDPSADWLIAGRGETYRLMERHDDALADFNRAIELDPGYDWAVAHRGETYRQMGHYDDALADYSRAIELDPDLTAIVSTYLAQLTGGDRVEPDAAGQS